MKSRIMNKLVDDSVILQSGHTLVSLELTDEIYNSSQKDNIKRQETIRQITKYLEDNSKGNRTGTIVSVWFFNVQVGKYGLEKSQQMALDKITDLYNKYVSGQLSLDDIVKEIKNDKTLYDLDKSYVNNARFDFTAETGKNITFDPTFDSVIWNLKEGETSPIHLAKTQKGEAVAYMFARLDKINNNGIVSYESWLNKAKGEYKIVKN